MCQWTSIDSPAAILSPRGCAISRRDTVAALLLQIGAPRLQRLGIAVPARANAEPCLYDRLALDDPLTAHSRYNALIRRLVSFERAAECVS
jgi:hypothetical protein